MHLHLANNVLILHFPLLVYRQIARACSNARGTGKLVHNPECGHTQTACLRASLSYTIYPRRGQWGAITHCSNSSSSSSSALLDEDIVIVNSAFAAAVIVLPLLQYLQTRRDYVGSSSASAQARVGHLSIPPIVQSRSSAWHQQLSSERITTRSDRRAKLLRKGPACAHVVSKSGRPARARDESTQGFS